MIPKDSENRKKMISYMLDGADRNPDNLTEWENNFIQSCIEQFNKKQDLSDRQCEILERIYNKI